MAYVHLRGGGASYVLDASGPGLPVCLHWGSASPDHVDLPALAALQARPIPPASLDQDVPLSVLPQPGLGHFGQPAIAGARLDGTAWTLDFQTEAVKTDENAARIAARDPVAGLALELRFAIDAETGVLTRSAKLTNESAAPWRLDRLASGAYELPFACAELLGFEGFWAREFQERRVDLNVGVWLRENRRGRASHDSFPGFIVGERGFSEERGAVYGFHLGWSGNHRLLAETQIDGRRIVQLGEWLAPGEAILAPGESIETPDAFAAFAPQGLNDLSARFHDFARRRVLRWPGGAMRPRPVHFNTWEANYFAHDLDRLKAQAEAAKAVGAERFVLDDGWFKGRDHDRAGLGDWSCDPRKYPDGLGPLIDHVQAQGLEFGLWIEPEMVNPDSDLYRACPDWVLHVDGRPRRTARNQLVLDLTRPEVSEHLFAAFDGLLRTYPRIAYLKWDMNRDLTEAGATPAYRRQTLAVYALIDRLRAAHPHVEIESCASGGGRADYGVLSRTQRIWTSDSNDALERQAIQKGFGRFFPPEVMGSHVGPSPCHTTGRRHSMAFRVAAALFGHMGLELDLLKLNAEERAELAQGVAAYKRLRALIHGGRTLRLDDPEPGRAVHGAVAPGGGEALFAVAQLTSAPYALPTRLRLPLDAGRRWRLRFVEPHPPRLDAATSALAALAGDGLAADGAALASAGLQLPRLHPETALLIHAEAI